MFDFGAPELLIILVIVIFLFGPGRLAGVVSELGKGIRSFKEAISSSEERSDSTSDNNVTPK